MVEVDGQYLDLAHKGRDEDGLRLPNGVVRRHNQYPAPQENGDKHHDWRDIYHECGTPTLTTAAKARATRSPFGTRDKSVLNKLRRFPKVSIALLGSLARSQAFEKSIAEVCVTQRA
jgi:hypothetical protein